jgi:hypothetical protein
MKLPIIYFNNNNNSIGSVRLEIYALGKLILWDLLGTPC